MIQTITLQPGITLRCFTDRRFKQGCLSLQLIRPMDRKEAALNALIPTVLLRGCESAPDLRSITLRLDDLYGASMGAIVRKVGDYHAIGLYTGFIDDRFAMEGDQVLQPVIDFLGQLLLQPVTEKDRFRSDYVKSEKKNLLSTIEAQLNDKRAYASTQLIEKLCGDDPFGIPRLGDTEQVKKITARSAWRHYQKLLRESPIDIFYVGQAAPEAVAEALTPLISSIDRCYVNLPAQTPCRPAASGDFTETMPLAQSKLTMGFVSNITIRDPEIAAMQVCNMIFGGGSTSLLFMNVREKMSLCYDIGSGFQGSKGILTVSAGIDADKYDIVKAQVLTQLEACRKGEFTEEDLHAAKQALISGLRGTHDSPGAIESYYSSAALSGLSMPPDAYIDAIEQVSAQDVANAARTLQLNTTFFLKGVS